MAHAECFFRSGDKVKAMVTFRGREIQHRDLADALLQRPAPDQAAIADTQQAPK
ncbi:MAG: hypothetical protein ICV62_12755 [Cyanobacteria bacterium Co-bin13]|nr:hypothetical protein [Cyanobacteria bacterium Co-bin13]